MTTNSNVSGVMKKDAPSNMGGGLKKPHVYSKAAYKFPTSTDLISEGAFKSMK